MRFETARIIASDVVRKLEPHCTRIFIAGSIRRERMEVGDIEIVCTPKKTQKGGNTLFENIPVEFEVDANFVREVKSLGEIIKGQPTGRYIKTLISHSYGKINCDIFIPQEHDFWRQYVIRTGSKNFAHNVVAVAWRKNGWVGTDNGLRRYDECENINEGKLDGQGVRMPPRFICVKDNPMIPPVWKSELDFFQWLNIDYVDPKNRNL